ncbi:MAG: hypothetical protein HYX27_15080 [Acidobacteria bacterium]|nr:hypothetical protein [Acidobacteriota bacterium]
MNLRIRALNDLPRRKGAKYVLYWTQMNRRADSNHALAYAAAQANALQLPLLVYEGLTCSYRQANEQRRIETPGAGYRFYLRKGRRDDNGVVYKIAADAALIVTGDYPVFITELHNARVPGRIDVALHAVDSSCVVPTNYFSRWEWAAHTIRLKIQKVLRQFLHPVAPIKLEQRWRYPRPKWHTPVTPSTVSKLVGERPVFGRIRYMGYDGMKRKTDVAADIREIDQLERTGVDPCRVR